MIAGLAVSIISVIVGIAVIIWPHLIAYIIGVWLIIAGILGIIAAA